jgi:FtsZ-binding cell division protein ZapB
MMIFDPITELKMNLDVLKKDKARLEEELNEIRANIEKYELVLEILDKGDK